MSSHRGIPTKWIIQFTQLNLSDLNEWQMLHTKSCSGLEAEQKVKKKTPSCPFSAWCVGTLAKTCRVSLLTTASSWSYIHQPLHLAHAHMGGEHAHQGHCLWLILKSMKAVFIVHAIHSCLCFLCPQRFCSPDWASYWLQYQLNSIIITLRLYKLALVIVVMW